MAFTLLALVLGYQIIFSPSAEEQKMLALKQDISYLEERVGVYNSEVDALKAKTKKGSNFQLLPQLSGKLKQLNKLKSELALKKVELESVSGS